MRGGNLTLAKLHFGVGFPGAQPGGAAAPTTPVAGGEVAGAAAPLPLPAGPSTSLGASAMSVALVAGAPGLSGLQDGPAGVARFFNPYGLGFGDASEPVAFVADTFNHAIRLVRANGETTTLAGDGTPGHADGAGSSARFRGPRGLAYHPPSRTLFVADTENQCIRAVGLDGRVRTVAGHPSRTGRDPGRGAIASFDTPCGVAAAADGTLFVADTANSCIRRISPGGEVELLAGSAQGLDGYLDAQGPAARLAFPRALALGADGLLYVADTNNHRLRRVQADGLVSTIAGSQEGLQDGPGATARFSFPHGIAADAGGVLYVADAGNHALRRIQPSQPNVPVDTLAGSGQAGELDGPGDQSRFFEPSAVAVAPDGSLWVLDTRNHSLRRVANSAP